MIQLIVSDIDSTLLGPHGELPDANVAALRAAAEFGVRLAFATIRKRDSTLAIANLIGAACTLICNGGATVYDERGLVLRSLTIPLDLAREIAALADQHRLPALATVDEVNYYLPESHPAAHIPAGGTDVERLLAVLEHPPARFIVRGEPGASLVMHAFQHAPLRFVRHFRADGTLGDVTITHAEATKESALAFLCQHWSIPPADVLAIGDAEADLGMLRMAGVGVAVGNAQLSVRAAADWVAPDASLGGVAAAIQRFVLGGSGRA